MDGKSKDIKQEKIEKLKEVLPEIFTEGKIDLHQLHLTLGEVVVTEGERYVLNWAGKTDAFKVLQETTTATLVPAEKESVEFDKTGNIFIEGENLEVLKVLQKAYYNKIKMIYIDPPYNTGNDSFIYPDRFQESKGEYLKRIGDKDEEGLLTKEGLFRKNNKESGHFHSNWLSMMYPRLFLARNLLREDGVIFVSIDDNEVHNLRLLMNEIFGEENFVSQIAWRRTDNQPNIGEFAKVKEYILIFKRNDDVPGLYKMKLTKRAKKEYRYSDKNGDFRRAILLDKTRGRHKYEIKTPSGKILYGPWMVKQVKMNDMIKSDEIYWTQGGDEQPYGKIYLHESEGQISNDFYNIEYGTNQEASLEVEELFRARYFDFPKPIALIKHLATIGSRQEDIILDFFAGSGTTAHAVLDLNKEDGGNRKFICVQMPEKCDEDSEAFKAGYKTIAEICKERIRRVIIKLKDVIASETKQSRLKLDGHSCENRNPNDLFKNKGLDSHLRGNDTLNLDLGFKVFKLQPSNFKIWRSDIKEEDLPKQLDAFEKPVKPESRITNMMWEILLKSGYDLNTKVEEKKIDGCDVFFVADNEIIVALSKISEKAIKEIITLKPKKFICLDSLFSGNDQLKTNTALQLKDAGIDFKTI
ncbi:MAG: DNA methylase [Elusimicrobia bacterium RIFOXYD2_FULL_34_15]|nr:MAG: DNA methylase [Elusimicrobia bacterium RIFOXYD2_FULL_34_15]HAM39528.1 site-specific DNA-methyltransferase [Elusimicrobiota bacterium]